MGSSIKILCAVKTLGSTHLVWSCGNRGDHPLDLDAGNVACTSKLGRSRIRPDSKKSMGLLCCWAVGSSLRGTCISWSHPEGIAETVPPSVAEYYHQRPAVCSSSCQSRPNTLCDTCRGVAGMDVLQNGQCSAGGGVSLGEQHHRIYHLQYFPFPRHETYRTLRQSAACVDGCWFLTTDSTSCPISVKRTFETHRLKTE